MAVDQEQMKNLYLTKYLESISDKHVAIMIIVILSAQKEEKIMEKKFVKRIMKKKIEEQSAIKGLKKRQKRFVQKISMFDLDKKQLCTLISDIYPIAVRVGGKPSFNGIQVSNKILVYLQNNQLEDKDIEKLGQEINSLSRIDGIQENTMILSVKNGKPVASLEGIPSEVPAKSDNLMIQRTLKYGDNIDLSKATINEKPITIEMIQ